MKYRKLREIVPVVVLSALVTCAYLSDDVLAKQDDKLESVIPKYINKGISIEENDLVILNLDDGDLNNYDVVSSNCIESIQFSNNNENIIIKLKSSEIYYEGYYNCFYQKYIYNKKNVIEKTYIKSN